MAYEIVGNTLVIDMADDDACAGVIEGGMPPHPMLVMWPAGRDSDRADDPETIRAYLQGERSGPPMVLVGLDARTLDDLESAIREARRRSAARLESN